MKSMKPKQPEEIMTRVSLKAMIAARWSWRLTVGLVVASVVSTVSVGEAEAQPQSGRVVADAKYTSPYDAFMKMNRFREEFLPGENADDYWGAMQSRLGNQAGRILIKRPSEGFSDDAFRGWLMFIRAYGDATGIGNCTSCHRVSDFTDGKPHNIGTASEPLATPSLRKVHEQKKFLRDGSAATLEEAITVHVKNGQIARDDKRAGVEIDVGRIALTADEIREVAAFLRSLKPVDREHFREHLINVVVQPVEIKFEP